MKPYNVEEVNNNSVEFRTDANTIGDSAEYDSLKGILYLRALLLLLWYSLILKLSEPEWT